MSIVEIHCPRCGSPTVKKDEENRYHFNRYQTEFLLFDPTKKEIT